MDHGRNKGACVCYEGASTHSMVNCSMENHRFIEEEQCDLEEEARRQEAYERVEKVQGLINIVGGHGEVGRRSCERSQVGCKSGGCYDERACGCLEETNG